MNPKVLLWFNVVAGISSIIGVILSVFKDEVGAYIALISFIVFLVAVIVLLSYWIFYVVRQELPEDYIRLSVFSSYETSNGTNGVYERYRMIQVKRLALSSIYFQFKWTGRKTPIIKSDLQIVEGDPINGGNDYNQYDKIKFVFKGRPLLFNETAMVHFRAEVDDIDHSAIPMDCYKVETFTPLIHFRATLRHKPNDYYVPAKLQKCRIGDNVLTDFQDIRTIPFDVSTKSYQYDLINPEVGYYYRILWER